MRGGSHDVQGTSQARKDLKGEEDAALRRRKSALSDHTILVAEQGGGINLRRVNPYVYWEFPSFIGCKLYRIRDSASQSNSRHDQTSVKDTLFRMKTLW